MQGQEQPAMAFSQVETDEPEADLGVPGGLTQILTMSEGGRKDGRYHEKERRLKRAKKERAKCEDKLSKSAK